MDVQRLCDFENAFQVDMGNILRDLALLMALAEKGQQVDGQTCETVVVHVRTFSERLGQFEQALQNEWREGRDKQDE